MDLPVFNHTTGIPTAFATLATYAILAAFLARRRTELRTDPKTERRMRFWSGRLGEWLFRLAGLHLGPREMSPGSAALSPVVTPVPGGRDA